MADEISDHGNTLFLSHMKIFQSDKSPPGRIVKKMLNVLEICIKSWKTQGMP